MRVVFLGTPEFAAVSLGALIQSSHEVPLVVTWPDRPAGRGGRMTAPVVKVVAENAGLRVLQTERVNSIEVREAIAEARPDVLVVVAFGALLRPKLLSIAPHGCLNVHASILPRHRGASPINAAILEGDSKVGVSLMRMDEGLDTGPVMLTRSLDADARETAGDLHDRLAPVGALLLVQGLDLLESGHAVFEEQNNALATTCGLMKKSDGQVSFEQTANEVDRHVRGYLPWPGNVAVLNTVGGKRTLSILQAKPVHDVGSVPGQVIKVGDRSITVACAEGAIEIFEVRPRGKRAMQVSDFLNGTPVRVGDCFEA